MAKNDKCFIYLRTDEVSLVIDKEKCHNKPEARTS